MSDSPLATSSHLIKQRPATEPPRQFRRLSTNRGSSKGIKTGRHNSLKPLEHARFKPSEHSRRRPRPKGKEEEEEIDPDEAYRREQKALEVRFSPGLLWKGYIYVPPPDACSMWPSGSKGFRGGGCIRLYG